MLVLAVFMLLCGLSSTLFYLVLPLSRASASDLASNAIFGSSAGLGILFGAVLVWQGINLVSGHASRTAARAFPPLIFFIVAFAVTLPLGLASLQVKSFANYLFPPWYFFAAVIPALGILAYAAHRLGKASGFRALVTAFTWGALGATSIAVVLELVTAFVLVLIAVLVAGVLSGDQNFFQQLQSNLTRMRGSFDLNSATSLFANPMVVLGALIYFAGIIPLVEETLKTLIVAFVDPRRTQRQDAVLWGIAAGAGFAIIENIFNGSAVLSLWAMTVLTRVGATSMHIANGVTMGRGWYAARVERRWRKLFIAFLTSVLFHALWNALAILLSGSALYLTGSSTATTVPANLLVLAIATALIILTVLSWVWIVYSVRSVREPLPPKNLTEGDVLT